MEGMDPNTFCGMQESGHHHYDLTLSFTLSAVLHVEMHCGNLQDWCARTGRLPLPLPDSSAFEVTPLSFVAIAR